MNSRLFSSPVVQKALAEGNVRKLNAFLGFEYAIRGIVVPGNHLGRTLGFPTANLSLLSDNPPLLSNGVYAVKILVHDTLFNGMANIGVRPTINGKNLSIEVHLFDFNEDIYDQTLIVYFVERIRNEIKFTRLEELGHQLQVDKLHAIKLLGGRGHTDSNP